jgi:hypothetical protein
MRGSIGTPFQHAVDGKSLLMAHRFDWTPFADIRTGELSLDSGRMGKTAEL